MAIDADAAGTKPGFLAGSDRARQPAGAATRLAADHPDVLGELAVRIADEHAALPSEVSSVTRARPPEHGGVGRAAADRERAQHDVPAHQPIFLAGRR